VTYQNNQVSGANIGFQWQVGANFSETRPVVLTGNQITNCDTGVLVQSNGVAHLETNVITGSGSGGGHPSNYRYAAGSGAITNSVYRNVISGGSGDGILNRRQRDTVAPLRKTI